MSRICTDATATLKMSHILGCQRCQIGFKTWSLFSEWFWAAHILYSIHVFVKCASNEFTSPSLATLSKCDVVVKPAARGKPYTNRCEACMKPHVTASQFQHLLACSDKKFWSTCDSPQKLHFLVKWMWWYSQIYCRRGIPIVTDPKRRCPNALLKAQILLYFNAPPSHSAWG